MVKKRNVWLGAICLLLMLGCLLSSCTGKTTPSGDSRGETNTGASASDDFDAARDIPGKAMERDFTILSSTSLAYWLDEEGGDQVAETAYKRTMMAEDKYLITVCLANSTGDVFPSLQTAAMMGDKCFDLVFPHPTASMVSIMTTGYYANLAELTTMELSKPWYNQSQVQNYMTPNDKLYIVTSDLSLNSQGFFCMVYNRELYSKFEFEESITDLVNSGEWTAEKFNEILTVTEFTLDGDPVGNENYGFLCNAAPSHRWTYAFGEATLVKREDGTIEVGLNARNMTSIAEAYDKLLYSHGDTVQVESFYNAGIPTSKNVELFKNGHGLFINWDVGSCYTYLHNLGFELGYAPLPKLNSAQKEYRTICASGFFAVPSVTTSAEDSGLVLEFLSAYSYQYFRQAFFETVLTRKMSENPEDYEMLEFLHNSKFFDFGYTLDQDETFVNMLQKAVVDNRAPSSVVVILKSGSATLNRILEYANNLP